MIRKGFALIKELLREDQGQGMSEYGLLIVLGAIITVGMLTLVIGPKIGDLLAETENQMDNATNYNPGY